MRNFKGYKIEPFPVHKMDSKKGTGTVCEVLRDIYHATEDDEIKYMSRVATSMCKAMARRLEEYKREKERDNPPPKKMSVVLGGSKVRRYGQQKRSDGEGLPMYEV